MGRIKKLFFYLATIFLGLFGRPIFAFAILDIFTEPIKFIIRIAAGMGLLILVSYLFLLLSNALLGWVTMPDFVTVSYTRPDNIIVQYGWTTVRDFTNLLFILVLIIIGIATALRIGDYEVKKTLPRLIIVALLINFTPMICGAIIDASNILMNFFLTAGTGGFSSMINVFSNSGNLLISAIRNFDVRNLFNGVLLFQALFIIVFNFLSGFVLLLFSILLLLRHIALWILVILAPLAFFCWILPATQKIWKKWWSEFIQWSFVGVGGAFFLYLSQIVTQNAAAGNLFATPGAMMTVGSPSLRNLISHVMVFSVPLILLVVGMFTTMSTSAMGANIITNKAKQAFSWGQGKAGGYAKDTWQRFKGAGRPITGRIGGAAQRRISTAKEKMEGVQWGKDEKGAKGGLKRIGGWMVRETGRALGEATVPQSVATKNKATAEGEKIQDQYTFKKEMDAAAGNIAKQIGLLEGAIKSGKLRDFMKAGAVDQKKVDQIFGDSIRFGFKDSTRAIDKQFAGDDETLKRFAVIRDKQTAHMSEEKRTTGGLDKTDVENGYTSYKDKVFAENFKKREDFDELSKSLNKMPAEKRQETMEHMMDMAERGLFGKEQIAHAGRAMGEEFISVFENRLQDNLNRDELFYHKVDPESGKSRAWIARFAQTSPVAKELGITLPENIKRNLSQYEAYSKEAERSVRQFSLESDDSMTAPLTNIDKAIQAAQEAQWEEKRSEHPLLTDQQWEQRQAQRKEQAKHEAVREKILLSTYQAIESKGTRAAERIEAVNEIENIIDSQNRVIRSFEADSKSRKTLEDIRTMSKARKARLTSP